MDEAENFGVCHICCCWILFCFVLLFCHFAILPPSPVSIASQPISQSFSLVAGRRWSLHCLRCSHLQLLLKLFSLVSFIFFLSFFIRLLKRQSSLLGRDTHSLTHEQTNLLLFLFLCLWEQNFFACLSFIFSLSPIFSYFALPSLVQADKKWLSQCLPLSLSSFFLRHWIFSPLLSSSSSSSVSSAFLLLLCLRPSFFASSLSASSVLDRSFSLFIYPVFWLCPVVCVCVCVCAVSVFSILDDLSVMCWWLWLLCDR